MRKGKWIIGGSPTYQIPIFQLFNAKMTLLTSYNPDDINLDTIYPNVDIINISSSVTTRYEFITPSDNHNDDRELKLVSKASDLKIDKIDKENNYYDIVMISPIAGELSKQQIEKATELGKTSIIDMQGLVRRYEPDGKMYNKLTTNQLDWILQLCDIVKISIPELDGINNYQNNFKSKLIITDSGSSVNILSAGSSQLVLLDEEKVVKDATGSGDIFIAAIAGLISKYSLIESVEIAHKITKFNLQIVGAPTLEILIDQWKIILDKY